MVQSSVYKKPRALFRGEAQANPRKPEDVHDTVLESSSKRDLCASKRDLCCAPSASTSRIHQKPTLKPFGLAVRRILPGQRYTFRFLTFNLANRDLDEIVKVGCSRWPIEISACFSVLHCTLNRTVVRELLFATRTATRAHGYAQLVQGTQCLVFRGVGFRAYGL